MSLPQLDVPRLLRQYGLRPEKSLGQNFLLDESALHQVVEAAQLAPHETVLEIGPGLGSLTRYLALSARSVVAVELDSNLIPPLEQVVGQYPNVQVVAGDILALDPVQLVSQQEYVVVANIPYYITSSLIRHLLEARIPPQRLILTLQHEVAKRICAIPGDMSLLALSVQVYGHPEIMAHIPANAFYPPPKVDSAVLRIHLYQSPLIPAAEMDTFFHLIKAGFSQKRKTLRNSLSAGLRLSPSETEGMLQDADIDPMRRAETLAIPEWHKLTSSFRLRPPTKG
ncbi:MAG: ribosomal RNA small subunit methyltransferase A [Chloroflexi bacterium RBG_13_48_10]|jgi:16S rRNA (adenine1518-N6/adenine1519-N6)-dimethyltransferase|nr:MAG: ribosomal RNA small subunit methyltransferase A [Chloroflexi bacterium RBG_13_48_10]